MIDVGWVIALPSTRIVGSEPAYDIETDVGLSPLACSQALKIDISICCQ